MYTNTARGMRAQSRSTALTRRGNADGTNFKVLNDQSLQQNLAALEMRKKDLKNLNALIKQYLLKLPTSKRRMFLSSLLSAIIPQRFYSVMPDAVMSLIAEKQDVLEYIEISLRKGVNGIQDSVRELTDVANEKHQDIQNLQRDIQTAIDEQWDAQKLQDYIAGQAGITIYEEIVFLLDKEFEGLSDEEKEACKNELLFELQSTAKTGEQLIVTVEKILSAVLRILHQALILYYQYVQFYRPIAVIRDAATSITETDQTVYAAKEALTKTFEVALGAIEAALDGAQLVENYRIAGPDVQKLLASGRERLEKKLADIDALRAEKSAQFLLGGKQGAEDGVLEAEVVGQTEAAAPQTS